MRKLHNKFNILRAWLLLYYTFIFFPILAGIDKYFNFFVDWSIYLNEHIAHFFYISTQTFMHIFGIIEIIIGLIVLMRPKLGGYLVATLFIAISINLVSMGTHHHEHYEQVMKHYDVALHNIAMAISAYVFILLTKELNR